MPALSSGTVVDGYTDTLAVVTVDMHVAARPVTHSFELRALMYWAMFIFVTIEQLRRGLPDQNRQVLRDLYPATSEDGTQILSEVCRNRLSTTALASLNAAVPAAV